MLPVVTIEGNAVNDPELRFTPQGQAVANFRVVANDRRKNQQTGQWEDGDALFLSVTCWQRLGENVAESVRRGTNVLVTGRLRQREFTTKDGETRTSYEITADAVGLNLRFYPGSLNRTERTTAAQQASAPAADPWATPAPQDDIPPF